MSSQISIAIGLVCSFAPCQINVVNKQLVSPISWNNLLSKTALGKSYIPMIDRHLDTQKIYILDGEGVGNL